MKPVVMITGVAGGIGCGTAQYFARQGWSVIGVDRQENVKLEGLIVIFKPMYPMPNKLLRW